LPELRYYIKLRSFLTESNCHISIQPQLKSTFIRPHWNLRAWKASDFSD